MREIRKEMERLKQNKYINMGLTYKIFKDKNKHNTRWAPEHNLEGRIGSQPLLQASDKVFFLTSINDELYLESRSQIIHLKKEIKNFGTFQTLKKYKD